MDALAFFQRYYLLILLGLLALATIISTHGAVQDPGLYAHLPARTMRGDALSYVHWSAKVLHDDQTANDASGRWRGTTRAHERLFVWERLHEELARPNRDEEIAFTARLTTGSLSKGLSTAVFIVSDSKSLEPATTDRVLRSIQANLVQKNGSLPPINVFAVSASDDALLLLQDAWPAVTFHIGAVVADMQAAVSAEGAPSHVLLLRTTSVVTRPVDLSKLTLALRVIAPGGTVQLRAGTHLDAYSALVEANGESANRVVFGGFSEPSRYSLLLLDPSAAASLQPPPTVSATELAVFTRPLSLDGTLLSASDLAGALAAPASAFTAATASDVQEAFNTLATFRDTHHLMQPRSSVVRQSLESPDAFRSAWIQGTCRLNFRELLLEDPARVHVQPSRKGDCGQAESSPASL